MNAIIYQLGKKGRGLNIMRRGQLSNVGDKIYRLRKQNGLSQEELADKIEVSRQSVSKWETNTMTPGTEQIAALAKLFKVSIDYLILNEEDRKEVAASQDMMPAKTKKHHRIRIAVVGLIIAVFVTVLSIVIAAISLISSSPNKGDVTASVNHLHFTSEVIITIGVIVALLCVIALCVIIYKYIKHKKEGLKENEQKEKQND